MAHFKKGLPNVDIESYLSDPGIQILQQNILCLRCTHIKGRDKQPHSHLLVEF